MGYSEPQAFSKEFGKNFYSFQKIKKKYFHTTRFINRSRNGDYIVRIKYVEAIVKDWWELENENLKKKN